MAEPDPGGGSSGPPTDLSHLQDSFNETQAKIVALKERHSEANEQKQAAQEKAKSIAQRLNDLKTKATRSRMMAQSQPNLEQSMAEVSTDSSRTRAETPGSEKIQLLRKQMELNRQKMSERESSKRDIEETLSQLRARFDSSQISLERSVELGRSMNDLSSAGHSTSTDRDRVRQLEAKVRILETELAESDGQKRVKDLENKILDLEETIKEKESLIDARTQAVTLMTENLSLKGKNTVDLLEDTQQEMSKMQQNFVNQEQNYKEEIVQLKANLKENEEKITNLEECNDILETTRYDLTVKNAELMSQIDDSAMVVDLNKLNQSLQQRINELEHQLANESVTINEQSEYLAQNRELEKENLELEAQIAELTSVERICPATDFQSKYRELESLCDSQKAMIADLEEKLTEKCVAFNVLEANYNVLDDKLKSTGPKSLFSSHITSSTSVDAVAEEERVSQSGEVLKLKQQLDESNKNQIKTKLKMKQMQKQIDSLKKASDLNRQILQLQDENQQLQHQVEELRQQRDEGNSPPVLVMDAGDSQAEEDLAKKIRALEETCHNQMTAIGLLEEQKQDMNEDLSDTKSAMERLRHQLDARELRTVKSEIGTIELEEQLELYMADKEALTLQVEELNEKLCQMSDEKVALKERLEKENHDLMEKLDKLSEKVSSAESIEILENLTQQEKQEMESIEEKNKEATKLREESVELQQKIELFTTERKEVLEKMGQVQQENRNLLARIEELADKEQDLLKQRNAFEESAKGLQENVSSMKTELKVLSERLRVQDRLESETTPNTEPGSPQKTALDVDSARAQLSSLETEVENYLRCKDKNGKFAISKKMAKQAKNCLTHFKDLLDNSTNNVAPTSDEVERLKAMIIEATSFRVEKEQLEEELKSIRVALVEANNAQEDQRSQISQLLTKLANKDELLREHETDTAKLLAEMKSMQESLHDQDQAAYDEVEQLREVIQTRDEELSRLKSECQSMTTNHEDEKRIMRDLIEEQKRQLIEQLVEHEKEIEAKLTEIDRLEASLNAVTGELQELRAQGDNRAVIEALQEELRSHQDRISDLLRTMAINDEELLEKRDQVCYLNDSLARNNAQMRDLDDKNKEYEATVQELESKLREVEEKNSRAANATDDVKIGLEKRIQELEVIVQQMDAKNKEQLEKLKKFAANLKKKVAQCNEMEAELKKLREGEEKADSSEKDKLLQDTQQDLIEKLQEIQQLNERIAHLSREIATRDNKLEALNDLESKMDELEDELYQKNIILRQLEDVVKALETNLSGTKQELELNRSLLKSAEESKAELEERLQTVTGELTVKTREVEKCKVMIKKKMKEILELKQPQVSQESAAEIESLKAQIEALEGSRIRMEGMEIKLQENVMYIESLEADNKRMTDKISKLEEGIAMIEERRNSTELKMTLLGAALEEKTTEFEQHEDVLVQRLSTLSAHDQMIVDKLQLIQLENEELTGTVAEHIREEQRLRDQLSALDYELTSLKSNLLPTLERETNQMVHQFAQERAELKRHQEECESRLKQRSREIEELENEMSSQFVAFEEEKRAQMEIQEKLRDDNSAYVDEVVKLRENLSSLEEIRHALQDELNRTKLQCDSMMMDELASQDLRMQIVHDQTELEHLREQNRELSQSHEQELDRLRCEIINLTENNRISTLEAQLNELNGALARKCEELNVQSQLRADEMAKVQALTEINDVLKGKIESMEEVQREAATQANVHDLKLLLEEKDREIANYQQRNLQLQLSMGPSQDPFASIGSQQQQQVKQDEELNTLKEKFETELQEKENLIQEMSLKHNEINSNMANLSEKYMQLQDVLVAKEADIQHLTQLYKHTESLHHSQNATIEDLMSQIEVLNQRIVSVHEIHNQVQVAEQQVIEASPPFAEEIMVQRSAPQQATVPVARDGVSLEEEVRELQLKLDSVVTQLTEKSLELDIATQKLRELEQERAAKRETPKSMIEKQVAQVSPQQVTEGASAAAAAIPMFQPSQFFETMPSASSFFDQLHSGDTADFSIAAPQASQEYENRIPVEEEIIVPKKAYVCYPEPELPNPDSSSMIPNVDDSMNWGWSAEEAILEEQHQQRVQATMTTPTTTSIDRQRQNFEDKIQELELERDRQKQEIHDLQLKSAKMLKKLKEYKAMNESLSHSKQKSPSVESNDLDLAIQDELKSQIKALETRLREALERKEKETLEKANLLKRIDVLTAANERMTEMKERQDIEMEVCQTKIRQLNNELTTMSDWSDEGGAHTKEAEALPDVKSHVDGGGEMVNVEELQNKLTDLAADHDELQAILEEERENSKKLEAKLARMTESNDNQEQSRQRIQDLEGQLKNSVQLIDRLTRDAQDIKSHLERLSDDHMRKVNENQRLEGQLRELVTKNAEFGKMVQANQEATTNFAELQERVQQLSAELDYKNSEIQQMRQQIDDQMVRIESAQEDRKSNEQIIADLTIDLDKLKQELEQTKETTTATDASEVLLRDSAEDPSALKQLCEDLQAEKKAMEQELQVLNDQVIVSLQLEEKMKATVLDLDLKQIEINQLKAMVEQLRAAKQEPSPCLSPQADLSQEVNELRAQIQQLNEYWPNAVEQRGNEVAELWKNHLVTVEQEYAQRIEALERRASTDAESSEQQRTEVVPQATASDDAAVEELRAALESQELEIVTLKEQLAIRSAEFAALSAKLDPYGHKATSNMASVQPKLNKTPVRSATESGSQQQHQQQQNDRNLLDLTMYTLHQRDMRCEELTHELLILLDERDTLQLKLSNAIRQLETTKGSASATTSGAGSSENSSPEKAAAAAVAAATTEETNNAIASSALNAKITEIQSANQNRSRTLREERDDRQRQMAQLQQDMANLPSEAVSGIVGDYAVAQSTNQSPSAVLFNWLWGKASGSGGDNVPDARPGQ